MYNNNITNVLIFFFFKQELICIKITIYTYVFTSFIKMTLFNLYFIDKSSVIEKNK